MNLDDGTLGRGDIFFKQKHQKVNCKCQELPRLECSIEGGSQQEVGWVSLPKPPCDMSRTGVYPEIE